jgi:hypothetical protein
MDEQLSGTFHWGHAIHGVIAATIGTTIEWYDFFVYGLVASLVFDKLFFPRESPYIGTLLALSTFAAGFLTRPIRRRDVRPFRRPPWPQSHADHHVVVDRVQKKHDRELWGILWGPSINFGTTQ